MVMHGKDDVFLPSGRLQQNFQFVLRANGVPVVTSSRGWRARLHLEHQRSDATGPDRPCRRLTSREWVL